MGAAGGGYERESPGRRRRRRRREREREIPGPRRIIEIALPKMWWETVSKTTGCEKKGRNEPETETGNDLFWARVIQRMPW